MGYDESDLRQRIQDAVLLVFEKTKPTTTTALIDALFVQIKPLVISESREYTVSQLREMLIGIS